ncbi:MAG: hypothetical protein HZB39_11530 [Planctomycetes bacterium]|nr:hypothetical protein [Planctomycetota bacterium]
MTRRRRPAGTAGIALVVACALPAQDDSNSGASCRVCHPGAFRALARTPHVDRACAECHGDVRAHVASAQRPESTLVPAGAVAASRCATCHEGRAWPTTLGAHPWRRDVDPIPTPILPRDDGLASFDWDVLAEIGQRFVSRTGSDDRFATDVDLDDGLRLSEARITGRGRSDWLDSIDLRARDVGDPWRKLGADVAKDGVYRASASREDRAFHHRTSGDFGRVSHHETRQRAAIDVELSPSLGLWSDFERFADDGFWLTHRLAGRGTTPLAPVANAVSPRRLESDLSAAGLRGTLDSFTWRAGVEYLRQRDDERWAFDREAPSNPLLRESEDFASRSALEGPGVIAALDHRGGPLAVSVTARHRELDRDIAGGGTRRGADPVEFVTTSTAIARGDARTTWLSGNATAELNDDTSLVLDLSWRDHDETLRLDSTEVTVFPSSGGDTTVVDSRTQRTAQERLVGSLELEVAVAEEFVVRAGWGFAREELVVPELAPGVDPSRGTLRDDGALLGARWEFAEDWTFDASYAGFGQSGLRFEEQQERTSHGFEGRLRRRGEDLSVALFHRGRRERNDASGYRNDRDSVGVNVDWHAGRRLDVSAGWVFSRADSSTLTSFWFDPDPNPAPTVVGFRGDTHVVTAGVAWRSESGITMRSDVARSSTDGSFDVATLNWRTELAWDAIEGGTAGLRHEHIDYDEAGSADEFTADLLMIFWRQRLGRRPSPGR